ncbi:MAG TPA: oxidoreductase, partial [Candidatus Tenderia electrophaga]|nr:oxidoreductase [Candidatus Tenderia electrophaga]
MKVINHRQIVEDSWQAIDDETSIEQLPSGKIIVSTSFWNENKQALRQRGE